MKVFIKNMVSERCKKLVKNELMKLHLVFTSVDLGVADITGVITNDEQSSLNKQLELSGLGVIIDKKSILVEKIKTAIVQLVHYSDGELKTNFSIYLSEKLGYDYTYMANMFSATEGTTMEKFMIAHKIERVKELLRYGELTLTQIANKLHYSSVSHLSNQFKKNTGYTPSFFKKGNEKDRTNLENV